MVAAAHDLRLAQRGAGPTEAVCALRALWRQRGMLLKARGQQGAAHAKGAHADEPPAHQRVRRRGGRTGQNILHAIVTGERGGQHRAAMNNVRFAPAPMRSPRACNATGAPSIYLPCSRRWPCLTSLHWPAVGRRRLGNQRQWQSLQVHAGEPAKGKKRGRSFQSAPGA